VKDEQGRAASQPLEGEVHHALRHLYDAVELEQSPLLRQLAGRRTDATPVGLRRLLVEAIELLKPAPNVPLEAGDWRYYRILCHRYVDQFTQQQVASNLSLSIRQLRREEAEAVRLLAGCLRAHYGLQHQAQPSDGSADVPAAVPAMGETLRDQEITWVDSSFPRELADVRSIIEAALSTIVPLAQEAHVTVRSRGSETLPWLYVQPGSLLQALLNLLTVAVAAVPEGRVELCAESLASEIRLSIASRQSIAADPETHRNTESLEVARRLLDLSRADLEVRTGAQAMSAFAATIHLPTDERDVVLAIDDNADALRLTRRCLEGTRYVYCGARDADEALKLAVLVRPHAITLDIMMPGVDGWRLLGRLRAHPQLVGVPIFVCSILPQSELALSLGAAAFLQKPFTRQALLATLDRLLPKPDPG
jgi:CheY-like chemotaxis protein